MSGLPGGIDGLHDRPRTRGGSVLMALGAAGLIVGVLFVAIGIGDAVEEASGIREDAVAAGAVGESIAIEGADGKQTVYLDLDGISNSVTQERIVAATDCQVTAEGFRDDFTGSRQGVSTTIGDLSSVGSFTLPDGFGRLQCVTNPSRGVPSGQPLLVSPRGGGAVFIAVLKIIGGVIAAGLGGTGLVIGWLRRRRAVRVQGLQS